MRMKLSNLKRDVEPYLTTNDVAAYLKMNPISIRTMAREKRLPGYFVGNRWRFQRSEIDQWIAQNKEEKNDVHD